MQLQLGELALRLSPRMALSSRRHRRGVALDRRLLACCAGAAVSLLAMLGASAATTPPLGDGEGPVSASAHHRYWILVDLAEVLGEPSPAPRLGSEPSNDLYPTQGEPCRCPGRGHLGCPDAPPQASRYGVAGPRDNPDPHLSRAAPLWGEPASWPGWPFGPFGVVGDKAPTAPWGRDWSLGTDPISARGHMWGDEIAPAKGMNMDAPKRTGGLSKVLTPDGREGGSGNSPRVLHTGLRTHGPLPRSAVGAVMAQRFEAFISCYGQALQRSPTFCARVELQLVVDTNGKLLPSLTRAVGSGDEALSTCLVHAVGNATFPSSNESSFVSYPLSLSSGQCHAGSAR